MFRFVFGVALASGLWYLIVHRPEWVQQSVELAREQFDLAARNVSSAASSEQASKWLRGRNRTTIDYDRARELVASMNRSSSDQLWGVMESGDYDRRAAAGQILLSRAGIPASAEGVDAVKGRYLQSRRSHEVMIGFSYLGLLALQEGVPERSVARLAENYVERHPGDPACDNALWALGELGSEDLVPYFFEIIQQEQKYGPAARERAFCCLVQCGRYSPARRLEMVPAFIQIYDEAHSHQTRAWALQALAHCAPGARAGSIRDWENWWAAQ